MNEFELECAYTYNLIDAIESFIKSSKDSCITIQKIDQLKKDCTFTADERYNEYPYNQRFDWLTNNADTLMAYISLNGDIYFSIKLEDNAEYILKFDNIATAKYLSDEFDFRRRIAKKILARNHDTFDYDEHEIEIAQDDYIYNIIVREKAYGCLTMLIVDKETRIQLFEIKLYIYRIIQMHDSNILIDISNFANHRFALGYFDECTSFNIDDLPENIKNYVSAQMTLIALKGK